ncbi:tRNA pseudouridine(38-40) synthase TruA [Nocardioides jiangxiensis]|uniref:tRNA pseudouridine synthase A n=1 Tax=Nocardioides jiangxiensis TaxID=3064524 RepID=A0ABT9B398_9ACTN|nr:tRNA pseudouridine(38-40) synthase TruA [Nocardioides sp. WY-20]MDO7868708.1 tRNA pseudouridine(38-40) synthase TruA [Nocardioides sp. WY-20]
MRIRMDLAYDGGGFKGWARQPALRTVQGELEAALATALRLPEVQVVCAGRTDTGVHARGQVVHLDVDADVVEATAGRAAATPIASLHRRLNGILPADVRIHDVTEAPEGFDARFSAVWRRYAYRVADLPQVQDPLTRNHVLHWRAPLDLDTMNEASRMLIGLKDFAAFCKKREGATTIRTLLDFHWYRDAEERAVATVRADAFCHSMVRALVGCMLAVGDGRKSPQWAHDVLVNAKRDAAVAVVAAHGLTLEEVGYPPAAQLALQAEKARARRDPDALVKDNCHE